VIAASLFTIGVCVAGPAKAESQTEIQRIIRHAFPDDQARALCISDYESDGTMRHWNPRALNGVHVGLFQIAFTWHAERGESFTHYRTRLSRARENAALARRIYLDAKRRFGNGWIPWTTRSLCDA
jgi:hypothetical protein